MTRRVVRLTGLALLVSLAACVEVIPIESAIVPDVAAADAGTDVATDVATDADQSVNVGGAAVAITSPDDGARVDGPTVRIEGTADDDIGVASVAVQVASNLPVLAQTSDAWRTWWVEVPVGVGPFEVRAWGFDVDGQRCTDVDSILLQGPSSTNDDAAPTVTIDLPEDGSTALQPIVLVRGTTSDDGGVARMELLRNGELIEERPIETDSFFAEWVRLVPLLPGEPNVLEFIAYDRRGATGAATITLIGRATDDRDAPELVILAPARDDGLRYALTLDERRGRGRSTVALRVERVQ